MGSRIYITRPNKAKEANQDEIKQFEKTALSYAGRGNQVYLIERFPKKFFQFATKIKIEKVIEPISSLSALSNSRLFKVVLTHNTY